MVGKHGIIACKLVRTIDKAKTERYSGLGEKRKRSRGIPSNFDRCRLLIVENGFLLDDETDEMLRELGAKISRVDAERRTPAGEFDAFDAAIIDIALNADLAFAWAEHLDGLDIPYVFATNLEKNSVDRHFHPYRLCADIDELDSIAQRLFGGERLN
jgi:hypothetical protein